MDLYRTIKQLSVSVVSWKQLDGIPHTSPREGVACMCTCNVVIVIVIIVIIIVFLNRHTYLETGLEDGLDVGWIKVEIDPCHCSLLSSFASLPLHVFHLRTHQFNTISI